MDPSFTFDDGGDDDDDRIGRFIKEDDDNAQPSSSPQEAAAWEFKDAIREAKSQRHSTKTFTTTDAKINKRLAEKNKNKKKKRGNDEADDEDDGVPGEKDNLNKIKNKIKNKRSVVARDDDDAVEIIKDREAFAFSEAPQDTTFEAQSFTELNLSRVLVKACSKLNYEHPTPIQASCIPLILNGRDVCGSAITGSGKTAAYGLPLLERLLHRPKNVRAIYVLVLVPTRELAVQVHSMLQKLAQFVANPPMGISLVVGGLSMAQQATNLRSRPEIVIATPNRLIDHLQNTHSVGLEDMSTLVLDEADRLLDMGFAEQVKEIISHCPRRRQTLLFSATMTTEVQELIGLSLRSPVRIAADPKHATPSLLTQEIIQLKGPLMQSKEAILLSLCDRLFQERTVIFTSTKQYAHKLKLIFGLSNLRASELHGNMSQTQRLQALEDFRTGDAKYLIATDVASRGLDIIGVQTVISFDEPLNLTTYIHRIGRTARAGKQGRSVTLLDPNNRSLLKQINKYTSGKLKSRTVAADTIKEWTEKIAAMSEDMAQIMYEERQERIFQKAEMEAQRATNLVEHIDEIKARPAKTWFQSTREKKRIQAAAREQFDGKKDDGKPRAGAKKDKAKKQKQGDKGQHKDIIYSGIVKAAKSKERSLKQKGLGPQKAYELSAFKEKKPQPRGNGKRLPSFGERSARDSPAKKAKREEPGFKPQLKREQKMELARRKRGGKSVKGFKSKKKHKRR